jgi:hypothetical protein
LFHDCETAKFRLSGAMSGTAKYSWPDPSGVGRQHFFSGGAGELLANAIKNQRDLQSLNLRDAGLGPKNSALVLNALVEAQAKLTTLDFSGDYIPTRSSAAPSNYPLI